MKKCHFFLFYCAFLSCTCLTDKNPLEYSERGIHIRYGIYNLGDGPREYKFQDVLGNIGFLTTFPWSIIRAYLSEEILNSVNIEYWIYKSIEEAELGIVELMEKSNLYMWNMVDFPLSGGEIGDNCWYQLGVAIRFIRNNVFVSVTENLNNSSDSSAVEKVARKIDAAIRYANKVPIGAMVPAPTIQSVEIISSLPDDWGKLVKVKVNASDLKSRQLTYREVGAGIACTNDNGFFNIIPDKSIPLFVSENPSKFKIMIWVWNENHLATLVEEEFPFLR